MLLTPLLGCWSELTSLIAAWHGVYHGQIKNVFT